MKDVILFISVLVIMALGYIPVKYLDAFADANRAAMERHEDTQTDTGSEEEKML